MSRALGAFAVVAAALWLSVWAWARLPGWTPLSADERAAAMRLLRGALDGGGAGALPTSPGLAAPFSDAALVTLYADGGAVARVEGRGPTVGAALTDAARALGAAGVPRDTAARGRIKVDLVRARGPIVTALVAAFAFSIVGGVDGVGATIAGRDVFLTADDLLGEDVYGAFRVAPGIDLDLGFDGATILRRLRARTGVSPQVWNRGPRRIFRFRAESFIEPANHAGPPLPVFRGNVPGPPVTRETLRRAAIAGGHYLLGVEDADGRFAYEYLTAHDQAISGGEDYSLPRHGGSAYFLAQLYAETHEPELLDGARRAIEFLETRARGACDLPTRACVGDFDDGTADLGSAALAAAAVAEYQRVSGDTRFAPFLRRVGEFILFMQKPDGDFCHLYNATRDARDTVTKQLYYSGEATFALAKMAALGTPEQPRYKEAMRRSLDHLTGAAYDYFVGQFFYGEDHWTCMAAEAGWDNLPQPDRERYARFCDGFAAFLRRAQFEPDEGPTGVQPDLVGSYGFSPILPPHTTPVGSRSEAAISIYLMDRRRGAPEADASAAATRAQIISGMRFLLEHQIDDDNAYLVPALATARGGLHLSDVARKVRIDFVQHSCSAMLRAIELL
jgi:hypothetical protein